MRKLKGILVLILLLALLASPIAVLASDISGAKYYGTIIVSNNSTATTNVAVNCTISTSALIDGGYLNSSANNCVVRSSAGAGLPFMPSVNASYPWCIWVPSIGQNTHIADILYTANSTGGEIRYFPTATGMTTPDSLSMELGANFTIEQSGWWDTVYSENKTAVFKEDAFKTYISDNETITSIMLQTDALTYQVDSSTDDIRKMWDGGAWVVDLADVGQYAGWLLGGAAEDMGGGMLFKNILLSQGQTITAASLNLTANTNRANAAVKTRITGQDSDNASTFGNLADFDARPRTTANITWDNIGAWVADTEYESIDIASIIQEIVDRPGWVSGNSIVIFWEDFESRSTEANNTNRQGYSFDGSAAKAPQLNITATAVTATGVESGKHTVTTSANITHMWIAVDNVTQDTVALGGASVPDNANDLIYYENMNNYWHYTDISVNSTQVQYIDWEYDTIFYDSSGFDNDATPTFRTTSSDPDVSAVLSSFLPIAEAQAPAYALEEAPAFIETVPTIVSEWDIVPPAGTFPLAGVIAAIASATDTPAQLPLLIIAAFIILAISLSISATMRRYGSGSLIVKSLVITALMGVFIALGNFGIDFWMLFVFLIIAVALSMGSKQVGWQ